MKEYFSTFGMAEHISSDSGVQFTSQQFKGLAAHQGDQVPSHVEAPDGDGRVPQQPVEDSMVT